MPFKLQLGENSGVFLICGILGLIAITFFVVIYVVDFRESRRKAKKKRDYERALQHAQRRKHRPG